MRFRVVIPILIKFSFDPPCSEVTPVPFDRLLQHFEGAIAVAGASHVGLGSDFDGVIALPEGIEDVRDLPKITAGLLAMGLGSSDVRSVLGANFRRVIQSCLA